MTPKRLFPVLFLAAAAGCKKDPLPATPAAPAAGTAAVKPAPPPTGDPAKASAFAAKFLDAVQAGTAPATQLTPDFKKLIAEPTFTADLERGYSDDRADAWLKALKGKCPTPDPGPSGSTGGGSAADGYYYRHGGGRVAILKLVPVGGDWGVDLFAVGPMERPTATSNAPAELTAVAFLAALLQPDDRLAEGLLTAAFKAKLAPPFGSDKRGYNRGFLESKLAGYRGAATTFRGLTVSGTTATAELVSPKGPVKILLTMTADGARVDSVTSE